MKTTSYDSKEIQRRKGQTKKKQLDDTLDKFIIKWVLFIFGWTR